MAKNRNAYDVVQVLELAVLVDEQQGFIKSGYGYYDRESETHVYDNKTTIYSFMTGAEGYTMPEITDSVRERAEEIRDYFRNSLVTKKLMGTLSQFEESVMRLVSTETTDNFGLSVAASLPNSFRVAQKREDLDNWFNDMRTQSEFIGKIGERLRFSAVVKDVKFIAKFGIHLVTCVDTDNNIVKFFFSKEPDIAGLLEGRSVKLTGKVKQHDVSKFSDCKETVINYVKVEESC